MLITKKLPKRYTFWAGTLTALAIGSATLSATPIPIGGGGILNAANMTGGLVAVTTIAPCIAFSASPTCATPPAVTGIDLSGTDPIFGTTGTIKDIGVSLPIAAFKTANLTIAGGPAIFDLIGITPPTGFSPCTFTTTSGSCSTGTFVLTQSSSTQVSISFSTTENGYLGSSSTGVTPYIGVFTTQLSGGLGQFGCVTNCSDVIGNVLSFEAGLSSPTPGTIKSTWSVTESPTVPEPLSFGLFGSGLVALALIGRKLRRS